MYTRGKEREKKIGNKGQRGTIESEIRMKKQNKGEFILPFLRNDL